MLKTAVCVKNYTEVIKTEKYAALYARVSTEMQAEEGYSIEAQKKLLEAWCVSREIKNFVFYVDAGFSGSNLERPAIKKLLEDIEENRIGTVAVYKLDRLSRSQKDTLFLIEDIFNPKSVDFVSLSENMDTSTPIGRAMLGIMSAFAQLERETIKIRTRMGMKERVKSGLWMGGGKIPFGYDYDRVTGTLVKNEDSDKVKKIYSLYLEGYSPASIAKMLDLKYERLVVQVLKRRTNLGLIPYKGEEYSGLHAPLIDEETYLKTAEEMRKRARIPSTSKHLLSGLIFCGLCTARMRYQKWGKKGYKLVCYSTQNSKPYLIHDPNCKSERVWADEVEEKVICDLFSMTLRKNGKDEKTDERKIAEDKSKKLKKKLSRLYEIYSDGDDTALNMIKDLRTEISNCEEKIRQAKKNIEAENRKNKLFESSENLSEIWPALSVAEQKRIINSLIEKIVIFPKKIEIHYFF